MGHYVYVKNKKTKPGEPGHWSAAKKTEAVLTWMATGNLSQTAGIIGVGYDTLKNWRKQPWWAEIVEGFHDDDKIELDTKYQKIIRKALSVVEDRLDNGNFQMDQKTGKISRVPVNMSDSHRVMKDLVDQQQVLRKDTKAPEQTSESINSKLLKLATQFAEMASPKKPLKLSGEVYEGEVIPEATLAVENPSETVLTPS